MTGPVRALALGHGYVVDLWAQLVRGPAGIVPVTPTEWALLQQLAQAPGRCVPPAVLLPAVWGWHRGGRAERAVLRSHVHRLRARLGPAGPAIVTVRGRGYQLVVP